MLDKVLFFHIIIALACAGPYAGRMSRHPGSNVEAKKLLGQASYGPEMLSALFQAFDEAWKILAPSCGQNPLSVHATRLKLANAILSVARNNIEDASTIRDHALRLLGRR